MPSYQAYRKPTIDLQMVSPVVPLAVASGGTVIGKKLTPFINSYIKHEFLSTERSKQRAVLS